MGEILGLQWQNVHIEPERVAAGEAYILQRQREGITIAKEQGSYRGRTRLERPDFDRIVQAWRDGKLTEKEVLEKLNMSKSTFYRRLREGRETQ